MAVVFDSSFLIKLLDPMIRGAGDGEARLQFLVGTLEKSRTKIIVPTPALCEVVIGAGDAAAQYLDIMSRSSQFKVIPFGTRAAVEAAAAHRDAIKAGDKREGAASWIKVKFDRQIVAIAKVEGAEIIYSNADDIKRFSVRDGIEVRTIEDLPWPTDELQGQLKLDPDTETKPPEPDAS
jgi:predicted nucleic acid-binding protein